MMLFLCDKYFAPAMKKIVKAFDPIVQEEIIIRDDLKKILKEKFNMESIDCIYLFWCFDYKAKLDKTMAHLLNKFKKINFVIYLEVKMTEDNFLQKLIQAGWLGQGEQTPLLVSGLNETVGGCTRFNLDRLKLDIQNKTEQWCKLKKLFLAEPWLE